MELRFFPKPEDFRKWLADHHDQFDELWVGYFKKSTGIESITWPESVDQALCYGWIDGIRKSIDAQRYKIRFTPRRPKSTWSAVNLKRVPELIEAGLMTPAGMAAYERRDEKRNARIYGYEQKNPTLSPEYLDLIKANLKAWEYFDQKLAPGYKRLSINWIMSAKREETRLRRLTILIESSEQGLKIPHLRK